MADSLDLLTDILLAIREDEELSRKLIDICSLPLRQRLVEIETLKYENRDHKDFQDMLVVLDLMKSDLVASRVIDVLNQD